MRVAALVTYLLLLSLIAGCGGGAADAPDLAKVAGQLMLDGKPKGGLTIEFIPTGDTKGPKSLGKTADDGSFMLSTATGRAGAVIGTHKVLIKCPWRLEGRGASVTGDGFGSTPDGSEPPAATNTEECTLDIKFEDAKTTTLSAEVPAEGVGDLLLQATSG